MLEYLFKSSYGKLYEKNNNVICDSVGSFIINLDRAKERLKFVSSNVEKLGFPIHRISAIDGNLLSKSEILKVSDFQRYRKYFKMYPETGTIGCSLSHEKTWREFLLSSYEFALILEDDVTFNPNILKECINKAIKIKNLWDILILEPYHRGNPVKLLNLCKKYFLCTYLTNVTHSGCYLINRQTAEQFLKKFYPIFVGLDHYINAGWEFDIKFLGIEPRLVKQNFGNSQIKVSASKKFNDFPTKLHNVYYNIKRSIMHFLYSCYIYVKIKSIIYKR